MKKAIQLLGMFSIVLFVSCSGSDGVNGANGLDGLDGEDGINAQVFEVDGVNFDYEANNNWFATRLTFNDFTNFEILESDAILVYRFDGEVDLSDGPANNWSLIPQNFFVNQGTIQYTFAHNFVDMDLFIDGNFDMTTLSDDFTQNQFFRIVILPGDFLSSKLDKSNMAAVLNAINVDEESIARISMK
ncbi:collagen-like protein [Cellulophaga baltica]|uniref:collagen-like protein n=1 Tax=Cellulophaga baltica TaxID=76594 RepID=UPI00249525B4|nr:collagen-like protein [Cellulophaga baltica]